jgi:LysR family transcriptional regulator, glycine cleavage system transcriptional activator
MEFIVSKLQAVKTKQSLSGKPGKQLPPLASLQAFEAAAKLCNFTAAAKIRNMTHSGVSRHVQTVEHWCGVQLFKRNGPQIELTDAGRALQARLAEPLHLLHQAMQVPSDTPSSSPLHLLTLPSFAATWLVPRLPSFVKQHPGISLSLHTSYEFVSLPPSVPCVALRFGIFNRDGLHAEMLFPDRMIPVATARWLKTHGCDPRNWPAGQMLRHTQTPWPARLPSPGNARSMALPIADGIEMNDALILLQAAEIGLGVMWARERLAFDSIATGQLVALADFGVMSERSYWLAYRAELAEHHAVIAFRRWALAGGSV